MTEVARMLAAGLLRHKRRESDGQSRAAAVSPKLDVYSEKSVNVVGQLAVQRAGQVQRLGDSK